ncbi:hypothetical protein [Kineococcus rubinsiae]|uniref:hypothetical protein n=1 Tax=Kineococcus rubinsiae TaxID=2609562 RepID=UPI001432258F|nr:hypothetical protein [Kineococcus rubinsiae]NIZ92028.1 hypothetical protein [Kineococcus rubinsiae]
MQQALAALESEGVPHCLRNGGLPDQLGNQEDVDVLVPARHRAAAVQALRAAGWLHWRAPGHSGHDFLLVCTPEGTWIKLDLVTRLRYGSREEPVDGVVARRTHKDGVWCAAELDVDRHQQERRDGQREVVSRPERWRRRGPVSLRRQGPVIALVGPDGAGKGTVVEGLRQTLPVAVTIVYLGDHGGSSGTAGRGAARPGTDVARAPSRPAGAAREAAFVLRKHLRLARPLVRAHVAAWRGHVVLCDRHPLDAVAVRPPRGALAGALEAVLARVTGPQLDALLVLDAPGAVLFERKGEHSPAVLEGWRQGYRSLPRAIVVDTLPGPEATLRSVRQLSWAAAVRRREAT